MIRVPGSARVTRSALELLNQLSGSLPAAQLGTASDEDWLGTMARFPQGPERPTISAEPRRNTAVRLCCMSPRRLHGKKDATFKRHVR